MSERIVTEVPDALKRLIKYVTRAFYKIEEALIMDLLLHHPCMKEEDIGIMLILDKKQVRSCTATLKAEHFLKSRMRVETDSEGKTTRHNYFFISYNVFINVVKYKLDNMRRKIETDERQSTHRSSFICPGCQKPYTDLDVGQLWSPSGQLICYYCQTEVVEEASETPKASSESLMVRFNRQMEPLFHLLKELDGIKLSAELLEPQPQDLKVSRPSASAGSRSNASEKWSGDATRNMNFGLDQNEVTISLDENGSNLSKVKPKEVPIWMKESTIQQPKSETPLSSISSVLGEAPKEIVYDEANHDDIMRTLLSHENKPKAPATTTSAAAQEDSTSSDSDTHQKQASSDQEYMESDEDEELMVTFGGNKIACHMVTGEILEAMTPQEKDEYVRVAREMSSMYD